MSHCKLPRVSLDEKLDSIIRIKTLMQQVSSLVLCDYLHFKNSDEKQE